MIKITEGYMVNIFNNKQAANEMNRKQAWGRGTVQGHTTSEVLTPRALWVKC